MNTLKIIRLGLFLTALLFTTFIQAQIKVNDFKHVKKIYSPVPQKIDKKQLIIKLNDNIQNIKSVDYDDKIIFTGTKGLIFLDDRVSNKYGVIFYFKDIFKDTIRINRYSNLAYDWCVYIPAKNLAIVPINKLAVEFRFKEQEYAEDFAMNMYYIQQCYQKEKLAEEMKIRNHNDSLSRADSIQFCTAIARYHELKEKPTITEEQRKFIVQANMFNEEKNYSKAIELYKKVIEINPVSYPATYYNLALLEAQISLYKDAIYHMKKYLLLLPDAPDARAAQDKIYEWEAKN